MEVGLDELYMTPKEQNQGKEKKTTGRQTSAQHKEDFLTVSILRR